MSSGSSRIHRHRNPDSELTVSWKAATSKKDSQKLLELQAEFEKQIGAKEQVVARSTEYHKTSKYVMCAVCQCWG
jgi:hypothetical protein